jgi:hypothetical protein
MNGEDSNGRKGHGHAYKTKKRSLLVLITCYHRWIVKSYLESDGIIYLEYVKTKTSKGKNLKNYRNRDVTHRNILFHEILLSFSY